jgi:ABC-type phosphate transport system substrate-binding protein
VFDRFASVLNPTEETYMFRRLFSRRGGAAVAVVALSVSGITTAAAGTAGATDNQTTVISGSGSNTIYQLDVELADLFNLAPGCNLSGGTPQPLNFACSTAYETSGTVNQPGENGEPATEENPNNDVVFNYPALGSGNGVNQLNGVNSGAEPDINFARSSATPANSNGTSAQNYVQFAIDGVSWVDFPSKDTKKITNLTVAQLQAIYADTPGYCTVKSTVYPADNWICYGAKTSLPIDCYEAQSGSGTQGTWKALIQGGSGTPACLSNETHGTSASHNGLFENEIGSIMDPSSKYYNDDIDNAIYFFSAGKYDTECTVKGTKSTCPGQASGTTTQLGQVNGFAATQANIQPTKCQPNLSGYFPIIRCLSNVYNNSSATGSAGTAAAPATQTTLNYTSEYGFMCKSQTATDIDPYTGENYRFEIETDILGQGFYPIDTGYDASSGKAGTAFAEEPTALTLPAKITDANYQFVDPSYTSADPTGYCLPIKG